MSTRKAPPASEWRMPRREFRRERRALLSAPGITAVTTCGVTLRRDEWLPIKVRLRCEGHLHTVSWFPGGPLVLHDHTRADIAARLTLGDMGAKDCKCIALLKQVRAGEGVHRDMKAGLDGHIARPLGACTTAALSRRKQHKHEKPGDDFDDYDSEHDRDCRFMPPATDAKEREQWVGQSVAHWKARINEVLGRNAWENTPEPLCWMLWHKRGLGVVEGHTILRIMMDGVEKVTALMRVHQRAPMGSACAEVSYDAKLPCVIVRVDDPLKPDARWRIGAWIGPDGEQHEAAHLAAAAFLTRAP